MVEKIIQIAEESGKIILSHYLKKNNYKIKKDGSPLTIADSESHNYICNELQTNFNFPILSEEQIIPYEIRKNWKKFWLIDPLDGTKDFINKNDEFAINIALIENQKPIFGLVHAPAKKITYYAESEKGSFKNGEKIFNNSKRKNLIAAISRFHSSNLTNNFLKRNNIYNTIKYGSSLKICKLAEGKIDIYPRLNGTQEWDTAAVDLIASEAGCELKTYEKKSPLLYNKKNLANPFFIASRKDISWN